MKNMKYLNDLKVRDTEQTIEEQRLCTLYNVSDEFFEIISISDNFRIRNHTNLT